MLIHNGRLELIDDQLYFPSVTPHKRKRDVTPTSISKSVSMRNLRRVGLSYDSPSGRGSDSGFTHHGKGRQAALSPYEEWRENMQKCQQVETLFYRMILSLGIHPRPAEILQRELILVFGQWQVSEPETFHVALPSRDFMAENEKHLHEKTTKRHGEHWLSAIEWKDRKDDKGRIQQDLFQPTELPPMISGKVASKLGASSITPNGLPYQPPGLVVYPSTFLSMSPSEIESHSSRSVHALLGCRTALEDFIIGARDEAGRPIIDRSTVQDYLWTFET